MWMEGFLLTGLCIAVIAFLAEYVDSTLGMGYGTTLTPILLLMGYEPIQVVPAVLLSELFTGVLAGLAHHNAGNADFRPKSVRPGLIIRRIRQLGIADSFRRGIPRDLRVVFVIAACSILGTLTAVFLAVSMSKFYLKLYIGGMVLMIGAYILLQRNKQHRFSWKKVTGLGLLASFNKGMSGGGYGPVVTGGQILCGVEGKNAVAVTSLAEGLTCVVGFLAYFLTKSIQDWTLFPFLCAGAILSVPLSAYTVKRLKTRHLKLAIGVLTTALGVFTLLKVLV
jgi:uncharacterized protein